MPEVAPQSGWGPSYSSPDSACLSAKYPRTLVVGMDWASRLENLTPMEARCLPAEDRHGRLVLVAIAKVTYAVTANGIARLSRAPSRVRLNDEPHDGSPSGSVAYPSDYADEKPGTDVVVLGSATPPEGRAVADMVASARVGRLFKAVRVFGTRAYQRTLLGGMEPGPAQRLFPTPLRYELAFGGAFEVDGRHVAHPVNPVGMGLAETTRKIAGGAVPRIELEASLLDTGDKGREPAGFGAIAQHWSPRLELAGTRDLAWQRTRAPIRPLDYDPRHACVAHPDLHSDAPLAPDEPVEIIGMTPEGTWRFRLPPIEARFSSVRRGEVTEHPTHLDTYLIDINDARARRVELVWRAAVPVPKKAQLLERITVRATGELPQEIPDALEAR